MGGCPRSVRRWHAGRTAGTCGLARPRPSLATAAVSCGRLVGRRSPNIHGAALRGTLAVRTGYRAALIECAGGGVVDGAGPSGRAGDEGTVDESKGLLVSFAERQRLVGKPGFDALEKKYAAD